MHKLLNLGIIICCFLLPIDSFSQYKFEELINLHTTSIKNQNKTGTCWSFATASFLESEILRTKNINLDLSEMFVVRNIYKDKALNYVLRQGKANFSQGSLAHDLLSVAANKGIVPQSAYLGTLNKNGKHDHSELVNALKGFLDGVLKSKKLSDKWQNAFAAILDSYLGSYKPEFFYEGNKYNPKTFAKAMSIDAKDYINLTSFSHHPFGESFILEIPDNFSNGSFHNIPLDQLVKQVNHALESGYTIAWDGDVSEKGFSAKQGIAILPTDPERKDLFENIGEEMKVNQENRQENFMSYSTTDDHLMHIIGKAQDQNGNIYYLIKNSWGEIGPFNGYLYMSESYLKMKTISITLHKDVLLK